MVRLRVAHKEVTAPENIFQFLHGAIKGKKCKHSCSGRYYFNSYMVRLRGAWAQRGGRKKQFQFLHGAIKG